MKTRKAFTLIELLIVIAIIGILSSVIYVSLNSAKSKASEAKVKNDVGTLATALEVVKVDRDLEPIVPTNIVDNTSTANDSNVNRWTDGGAINPDGVSGKGTRLVKVLPTNPFGFFRIRITNAGYAIIGSLGNGDFWCNTNGNGREITGKSETAAVADCGSTI